MAVEDFTQTVEEARAAATLIQDELAVGWGTSMDEVDARLRLAISRIDLLCLLAALGPDD